MPHQALSTFFNWRQWTSWAWFLVLLLALGGHAMGAPSGSAAIGTRDSYVLSGSFTYIEDASAALTLEDVHKPEVQARFKPVPQGATATNFGTTNSAIWLRVLLQTGPDTPRRWLLELAYPPLDRLDLYLSKPDGGFAHQSGGDSLPFPQRPVPHRNHVKPIDLQPGSQTILYLRIASQGVVSAPAKLWQPAALWQDDQQTYSIFSLYFGLLIGLLLYNLLLFVSVRDRTYLIYVAFVACIGVSQATNSGLGAQFLWPDALWWNGVSINAAHAASGTFGIWFARSFLDSRAKLPVLDRWLRAQVGLWIAAFFVALFLPYKVAGWTVTGLAAVGVPTLLLAGVVSIRRRHPGAIAFGLAWGALLFGVTVQVMHNYGLLPSNLFTADALLIGSALEMVLLSFALADRINVARREKEAAQAQVASKQAIVQALQQSQARYRSVIEHVGEGMVVVQHERIVFVNFRATEILQATKASILEDGILSRVHPEDRAHLTERVRRRLAGLDVPEHCQARLQLPDGGVKWLEFGDNMVPWDDDQGLLVFFLDVTQRHEAELAIRAAMDRQQELNELRSRFISMTSHEFRTPLATILSAQDLLKSFSDRLPADEKVELLDMIEAAVNRMTRMLERVMLLGQAEANMLEFKPRQLDPKPLCEQLALEAGTQQPDSRCDIVTEFSKEPLDGLFDENLLRHIFSNLLSNAIKYSPVGGTVRLRAFKQGAHTVFEVSDQGIGIPADEIAHLFGSFHRASNVGDIKGTGLGLAIVKQSVDLHGGTIAAHSQVGLGSCFTVRFG